MNRRFSDCVKQRNGGWLCWDEENECFITIIFKETPADECDPCAIKSLFKSLRNQESVLESLSHDEICQLLEAINNA
jgi:hypothetical protein